MINLDKKVGDYMEKNDNKVDFDLSALTLQELIKVYSEIEDFLKTIDESKIVIEEKKEESEENE